MAAARDKKTRGKPFEKGNRLGGRPRGSKNRRTLLGRQLLAELERGFDGLLPARERWRRLLSDRSAVVRLKAECFLHECLYGRAIPTIRAEIHPASPLIDEVAAYKVAQLFLRRHPALPTIEAKAKGTPEAREQSDNGGGGGTWRI